MKNDLVKIEGTHLVREVSSMGLSNLDQVSKNDYYSKVQMLKTQKHEINNMKSELYSLKEDLKEIKQLLTQLIKK
jgi:cell shape-determining protein MreC